VTAGIGEADILEPEGETDFDALFACMRARLAEDKPGLRYYGGFRFQEGRRKGERWQKFKAYRFIVPCFEVQAREGDCVFAVNLLIFPDTDKDALIESVLFQLGNIQFGSPDRAYKIPPVHDRLDTPNEDEWQKIIARALQDIGSGELEKVVLARETSFLSGSNFDPVDVVARLEEQTFNTFVFCFQPAPYRAFLGASPERLYKRTGTSLLSEALAGTRPGSDLADENAKYADELLNSEKDQREHHIVVKMLKEHLAPLCSSIAHPPAPGIMPLRNCQHLHTPFTATLHDAESDAALLQSLHPTPAVGGLPRAKALAWLDIHEPFDRGIYAAPVGWVSRDSAEFSVAIRSAIVREETLALYAGAGIIAGSRAEEEWAEINQKMKSLLGILTEDKTT
jgi:menaquinone-specific isochorismate synthase